MDYKNSQEIISIFTRSENSTIDEINKKDFLLRENSNFVESLSLLRHNIDNYEEKKFLYNNIYTKQMQDLADDGVVYIHDKQLAPYCNSVSCLTIASIGVPTAAKNMISSRPTKKIRTFLRQISNLVVLVSQQSSGAIMLSQLTTVLAGYIYKMKLDGKDISEEEFTDDLYNLIWELNLPLRSGSQSAFSNVTLEFGKPSDEIKNQYIMVGGQILMQKYKDIPTEIFDFINKCFVDAMSKGTGTIPFTFPLITVSITDDFDYSNKIWLYLLDKMYYFNGFYIENFTTKAFEASKYSEKNPMIKPRDPEVSRSLCCRLQLDLELLSRVGGGIFGSSSGNTGAVAVLNANMNRLLLEYKHEYNFDMDRFKNRIKDVFEILQENHQRKREWILANKNLYPTFFALNKDLSNYFNVFAVTGFHEGLINIGYKEGMNDEKGKELVHEILKFIHEIISSFILRDKVACGLEFAPAEGAGVTLARKDLNYAKEKGIDIFVQGNIEKNDVYITSGAMIPFSENDFLKQIENAAEFQGYATSGSILHQFIEEKLTPEALSKHVKALFKKPIIYSTLTPTSTSCMSCGTSLVGADAKDIHVCPKCGSDDLATFSRVIGYSKMISRKGIKLTDDGKYEGEYNFWSNARRYDWAIRHRVTSEDILEG